MSLFRTKPVATLINESAGGEHGMKRVLGPVNLISLGIGSVVGAGIFVLAGTSAQFEDPTFAGTVPGITTLSFPEWDKVNVVLAKLNKQGVTVEQLQRH